MSLPKIKDFTDFNHYPSDPQPTTDADMQDYMQNQNDILAALTKRLWQPQTEYKLGDIVASDTMADGLVAVCTISGVTSDIEPTWGVNEATVIDNSCTWIMRPAYCYGLATEGDVQTVYDGGEAEVSRLLSLGVVGKIFNLLKSFINEKIKDLFGESNILPIVNGGTGATTAQQARENLGAGEVKDVSISGTTITVSFADGTTKTLTTQDTMGLTASQSLSNKSGYIILSNGLTLAWGVLSGTTATFPCAFRRTPLVISVLQMNSSGGFSADYLYVRSVSTTKFVMVNSDNYNWFAIG